MLPPRNRLKQAKEIEYVFSHGSSAQSGFLFLRFARTKKPEIRFAISVGKNFSPLAVKRNRAKRVVREDIKKVLANCRKGFDIVVFFRLQKDLPRERFEKETGSHLRKALEKARIADFGQERQNNKKQAAGERPPEGGREPDKKFK